MFNCYKNHKIIFLRVIYVLYIINKSCILRWKMDVWLVLLIQNIIFYTYKIISRVLITLKKSDCKYKMNVWDQTYTKLWFVTSTDLSVISSELLSLPQTISLHNKMELSETCHFHQFFLYINILWTLECAWWVYLHYLYSFSY